VSGFRCQHSEDPKSGAGLGSAELVAGCTGSNQTALRLVLLTNPLISQFIAET
jgi:hypothetical protein